MVKSCRVSRDYTGYHGKYVVLAVEEVTAHLGCIPLPHNRMCMLL